MNRRALALAFLAFAGSFVLLCRRARDEYGELSPSIERCLTDPARYDGREVRVYPNRVVEVGANDFTIADHGVRIRVTPRTDDVQIGDYVGLVGTFRREGLLDAKTVTRLPNSPIRRRAMFGVSILAMAFAAFLFLKTFRVSAANGLVRSA